MACEQPRVRWPHGPRDGWADMQERHEQPESRGPVGPAYLAGASRGDSTTGRRVRETRRMARVAVTALLAVVASVLGCGTRSTSMGDASKSTADAAAQVPPGFLKIDSFVRGDARIAPGQTRDEVREQLSKGKVASHKPYAFRKPQPEMFERDVWAIFYGPEVPGMGRVDELRVSFKNGKVSKLEQRVCLCP